MSETVPVFRFIDLFSGIGGFHHALAAPTFGGECVLAVDIDEQCRRVYATTWPKMAADNRILSDIREITRRPDGSDRPLSEIASRVKDHDVLCAGFPCQPFSKSGAQLGVRDTTRGTLFFDILRIVEAKRPKFLILENVRNLAGPRHVDTWKTIVASLRSFNYRVSDEPVIMSPHLLAPGEGGSPQSRDRVFVLATRVDDKSSLKEPPLLPLAKSPGWDPNEWDIQKYLLAEDQISNLSDYQLRKSETAWIDSWQAFVQGITDDTLPGHPIWVDAFRARPLIKRGDPPWKINFLEKNSAFYLRHRKFIDEWLTISWIPGEKYTVREFPASRRKFEWQARLAQPLRADRNLWTLTIHLRPSGVRVKPATYLPALVAMTQTSIIGPRRRRITPLEAARLQGIPDHVFLAAAVDDATAYRQVGNGVHVGVVQKVARALFRANGLNWGCVDGRSKGDSDEAA